MTDTEKLKTPFPWRTAIAGVVIIVVTGFALIAYLRPITTVQEIAHRGVDAGFHLITNAPAIAARFKTGTITHTFRAGIPEVHGTHGDVLEVAVSRSDETFMRSDSKWVAWDWLYLGTTVAEIRVPVTYRYHVRLSDPWRLAARDQVCIVLAPPIRPSLPPAIHLEQMEKRAESGWARFDGEHQLKELERSITGKLAERAGDEAHMNLVRDAARRSVATFVRNWLMREDHWRSDRFTAIVVVFPDEVSPVSDEELARENYEPTIRLESEKGK